MFSFDMDTEVLFSLEKYYIFIDTEAVGVCIKDPDNFYCKEWE
jgi:hypothetical protein